MKVIKVKYNLFLAGLMVIFPVLVFASCPSGSVCIENPIRFDTFPALLGAIAKGVATIIGGLGVIMIIYAGILFLISAGDPGRLGKAKTALGYAIIGIAVALAATGIIELIKTIIGATE